MFAPGATAVLLFAAITTAAASLDWQWKQGRATAFGDDGKGSSCTPEQHDKSCWSIHQGNCGYGYIWKDEPCGWDVAAISDRAADFAGSCGRCYEVKCRPDPALRDGYGATFDRSAACYDPDASVVVRIVDACPCSCPANPVSNKCWCCGDQYHFDLSIWAFEKLANLKYGAISLLYHQVPCSYQPEKPAPAVANPTRGQLPSAGAVNPMQHPELNLVPSKRWSPQQSDTRYQAFTPATPASTKGSGGASGTSSASTNSGATTRPAGPGVIFDQALQNGWWDRSWGGAQVDWAAGIWGPQGQGVACADLPGAGALSVGHTQGAFGGMARLTFWAKVDGGTPSVAINIGSDQRACSSVALSKLPAQDSQSGWTKFDVPLSQFGGGGSAGAAFGGFGGLGFWDVTNIEFKAPGEAGRQMLCLASLELLA